MTRIPTRSRREAMDWSLVLVSQGIETAIDFSEETGWGLVVPESDREHALASIEQYRRENARWPWRRRISREGILFDWAGLGWVLLVICFFWIQQHRPGFREAGLMDAAAVSRGEWWRLFTAIFLHGDVAHLALNASTGLLLLGLAMGRYGTGLGLLAALLAGVGGNVASWPVYAHGPPSLGASGMG